MGKDEKYLRSIAGGIICDFNIHKGLIDILITVFILFTTFGLLASYFFHVHDGKIKTITAEKISQLGAVRMENILNLEIWSKYDLFTDDYSPIPIDDIRWRFVCKGISVSDEYLEKIAGGELTRYDYPLNKSLYFERLIKHDSRNFIATTPFILWAHPITRNGYVPYHSTASECITGNLKDDMNYFRTKRIYRTELGNLREYKDKKGTFSVDYIFDAYPFKARLAITPVEVGDEGRVWGWYVVGYTVKEYFSILKISVFLIILSGAASILILIVSTKLLTRRIVEGLMESGSGKHK